jgi:DNA polymerase-3 subunit epsilon
LDTETTGLDPQQGHRIIEIGCVEIDNRRLTGKRFQRYLNPQRAIDVAAIEVHGITNAFLADKPSFAQIVDEFLAFVTDAELIIHNAPFDIGFLDNELGDLGAVREPMKNHCSVLDTLLLARSKHPGQRNSLDALCKRYGVDNTQRELHGALLDAEILADVYLLMTTGQSSLSLKAEGGRQQPSGKMKKRGVSERKPLPVVIATEEELVAHKERLQKIDANSDNGCLWLSLDRGA